ncbi:glycoside hydrolase family 16 protein [Algoriphagus hitonicola]|uniref:Glycosyl hydrolases family 16 n=1 Tax=Algoriphagus hitonicola TaxID=435880 RepID=A0A1I2UCZ3_9BACT|nr:glycoside hydrolase family 16 protein [Algoriphagus hitonicola]SFG72561.1 Glycosyl hydrolases family 16 [Algoriphagus hitonicola]
MKLFTLFAFLILSFLIPMQVNPEFHDALVEEFDSENLQHFEYVSRGSDSPFKWRSGISSKQEKETSILSFKLDPKDPVGPGRGPEISSKKSVHFGHYAARLKVPDARFKQANVGAVVGYFTYTNDSILGLSEIDFEWLLADPEVIYVGTWTGKSGNLKRVGRTINLAQGLIYTSEYREDAQKIREDITHEQHQPTFIETIPDFDASAEFHTYGFDWYPDRIRWWMIHPYRRDTLVLWDYRGTRGIPQHPSKYLMNFWHTDNWAVETNPQALEKPKHRFELEVDWMSYRPLKK